MKIIALATCHNRRAKTLRALASLREQVLPGDTTLQVCLVDDGSTDGTGAAVAEQFPEVKLLRGDGQLFWAGGMRFGWDQYVGSEPLDYLLVFNDDVSLEDNALQQLLETAREVESEGCTNFAITGAFRESTTGSVAYGGVARNSAWHPLRFGKLPPNGVKQECDTLNMNLALISAGALREIGFLSEGFVHAKADYDFGLRLRARGGRIVLAAECVGTCDRNPVSGTSAEPGISYRERWRRLTSFREQSPRERALYYSRHAGFLWPLFWLLPYVRIGLGGR